MPPIEVEVTHPACRKYHPLGMGDLDFNGWHQCVSPPLDSGPDRSKVGGQYSQWHVEEFPDCRSRNSGSAAPVFDAVMVKGEPVVYTPQHRLGAAADPELPVIVRM